MQTIQNIIKYNIIAGLFIIPFIAFIVPDNMFFPFITGKGFTFRILVEILLGLYIALAFIDKSYRPKLSWITKSFALFVVVMFVADLLGENSYKSLWSNYERMEGFVLLAHLFAYYLVLSSVFKTQVWWNRFINTNIVASVIMTLYGVLQLTGGLAINQGGVRVDGTFGNASYFAIYLVINIFLCLYMILSQSKEKWQKWMYGGVVILELIVLYYTATRGAILGLIGGFVILAVILLVKGRENPVIKKVGTVSLIALAVLVLGFVSLRKTEFVTKSPVMSRFSTLSYSEFQNQGRYYVWPMAIEGIKERPLLGWGQENFNFVFNKYYNPSLYGQEEWFDRTHNVALDKLVEGGILGLIAYVSMFISLFYYLWRKNSNFSLSEKGVLTALVAAYVFHNLFVFDNLISYILFFTLLAYVHHRATTNDEVPENSFYSKTFSKDVLMFVMLPAVTVAIMVVIYFVNVPALSANFTLIESMRPQPGGDVSKNLDLFKKVFTYNSFGSGEAVEQVTQIAVQAAGTQSNIDVKTKQAFYDFAKQKLEEKVASQPNDARYLVFAGSFFNRFQQYDVALNYIGRAQKESPKKQSILIELGSIYLSKGQPEKMMELFKQAYDLKPSSTELRLIYAIGAVYTKNTALSKELLAGVPEDTFVNDARVLKAYADMGDYNTVIAILVKRIEKNPKDLQAKLSLSSAYSNIGQNQKAIDLIREVILLEPSFKEQGEQYIKELQ